MIIVNYEIYVLEQARGWMLHARFPRQEREAAIAEAKELEQTLSIRVKVMRETYYTDDNVFEEAEVYISGTKVGKSSSAAKAPPARASSPPRAASSAPRRSAAKPRPAASAAPAPEPEPEKAPPKPQSAKAHTVVARLLAITAFALACAFVAIKLTPNVIVFLWNMGFKLNVTPDSYGQVLFGVFVLTFLSVAIPAALRFLPRQTELPVFRRPAIGWPAAGQRPDPNLQKSLDKLANQALADAPLEVEEELPPLPELDPEPELPEIQPDPEEDLPEISPDPEEIVKQYEEQLSKDEEQPLPEIQADPQIEQKPAQAEESGGVSIESQHSSVMRFLNGAVNAIKAAVPVLDSYNKFALHLYMAGGVETLCEFRKLGEAGKVKLTMAALETLGTKGEVARKFHEKLDEYVLEPRYLGVVQAGRDAMGDFMVGDETGAHHRIKDMMKEWNRPAEKKSAIVTVMFTDMVGSTDLTQERGDAAAQEIVRRHNSIVRGALAQFGGKEIKHTGDGIMASFASAASAVEATVQIQRQTISGNQRNPDLEMHLRIGLNAGEPIEEEDDLFGTTVQLAARVCAATNTDQILCTGVVKDLSFGKGGNFRFVGEQNLKGFKDAIALYEIVYQ